MRGEDSASGLGLGLGSAPWSSRSFTMGAAPGRRAATMSGVRRSSERALTSAPRARRSLVLFRSRADQRRAVAFASLRWLGLAPRLRKRRRVFKIGVQRGVHEDRGSFRTALVEERRITFGGAKDGGEIAGAERPKGGEDFGTRWRRIWIVGGGIRPMGALIIEKLDERDFVGRQRSRGRHLGAVLTAQQTQEDHAVGAAAGHDATREGLERRTATIQAGTALLFSGAVALGAVFTQDGSDIAVEVDGSGSQGARQGMGQG